MAHLDEPQSSRAEPNALRRPGLRAWPGSRWWRCDLHVHTSASHDSETSPQAVIDAALEAGLDVIAVTDHNTGKAIDEFAALRDDRIAVFPGVELTCSEGAHLLVLFDIDATTATVTSFLGRCEVAAATQGTSAAHSRCTYQQCMKHAHEANAICIAAHADLVAENDRPSTALLDVHKRGNDLQAILASGHLHAVELCTDDDAKRRKLCNLPDSDMQRRPHLRSSDAHEPGEVGRASTWIKMTSPTLEGLRLAFADGQRSLLVHDGPNPNQARPANRIEKLEVVGAKKIGRSKPFKLDFNPWLNSIIGGRSTGKSSVVELLRLTLDRGDDLPTAFVQGFQEFARVPPRPDGTGMLLPETRVAVTYSKDEARFRVTWEHDERVIERELEDGSWERAEGDVAQRFPARIFSQKQVFALAEGSEALLHVIDAVPDVGHAAWLEAHDELKARFLSERAAARAIETRLADRGRLRGELDDLNRKIRVFEGSDHRAILREYGRRQQQDAAITEFDVALSLAATSLQETGHAVEAKLDRQSFDVEDPDDNAVVSAAESEEEWLDEVRERLNRLSAEITAHTAEWQSSASRKTWQQAVVAATDAYSELAERLQAEEAGTPRGYANLLAERQRIEVRLTDLVDQEEQLRDANETASQTLRELLESRQDLTRRRTEFVRTVLADNDLVRIEVIPYGDQQHAEESLRDLLGTRSFQNDIVGDTDRPGFLLRLFADIETVASTGMETRLTELRKELASNANGVPARELRDQRFALHLAALTGEAKDLLAFWAPSDAVRVQVSSGGRKFLPVEQASPGSKSAGMLAFLLAHGEDPIILDQPEDDLDNRLINNVIVEQLRSSKLTRQILVITHNPNIVVNGDAEYVASMDLPEVYGQIIVREEGGLQQTNVRDEICAVMEGGKAAFEQRYRRIAGWQTST